MSTDPDEIRAPVTASFTAAQVKLESDRNSARSFYSLKVKFASPEPTGTPSPLSALRSADLSALRSAETQLPSSPPPPPLAQSVDAIQAAKRTRARISRLIQTNPDEIRGLVTARVVTAVPLKRERDPSPNALLSQRAF